MIRNAADVVAFIEGTATLFGPLRHLRETIGGEIWIAAGFIRNPVWDALCGFPPGTNPPSDIDVIRFDSHDADPRHDAAIEATLARAMPGMRWQVRNQARMAARNQDAPYPDLATAIAHWPETATAIAARWTPSGIALLAPHGLDDLLALRLRPTPRFARDPAKMRLFDARCRDKAWSEHWPAVTVTTEFG